MSDPITQEVIRGRLEAIADEMQIAMIRSAFSQVITEASDASSALFSLAGEVIAQAAAIPLHLGALVPAVRTLTSVFPAAEMRPGDVYVMNDPFAGGAHLPDFVVAQPAFADGRPIAIACTICHHGDVGGKTPGSIPTDATDIFQEGIRIPAMRLFDAGARNETLIAILRANVREPEHLIGDLDGQVTACSAGVRGVSQLVEEYGLRDVEDYVARLLDASESLTRAELAEIPDGTYRFEDCLDNDGVDLDRLVPVAAAIRVSGSEITFDFSGTSEQVRGPLNAAPSTSLAAAYFVVRSIVDPLVPMNGGCYRPIAIVLPEGSLVNPRHPAALNARSSTFNVLVDVLFGALAQALPDRIPAASFDSYISSFGGIDPQSGSSYVYIDIGCGGLGARPTQDGLDVFRGKGGNTLAAPTEAVELDFPLRVVSYRLRADSGGPGRYRGGLGYEKVIELVRGEAAVSHRGERYRTAPWGLAGGRAGACSTAEIRRSDGGREKIETKGEYRLQAGDRIYLRSAGGGGHGDPTARHVAAVRRDIRDGKVSTEAANAIYGYRDDAASHRPADEASAPAEGSRA